MSDTSKTTEVAETESTEGLSEADLEGAAGGLSFAALKPLAKWGSRALTGVSIASMFAPLLGKSSPPPQK